MQGKVRHARSYQEGDARPDEALRRTWRLEVRGHEQKHDAPDEEADRAPEAHEIGPADEEGRQSHAETIGSETGHREHHNIRHQTETLAVRDDVADRERDEDAKIPGLLGVAVDHESVDDTLYGLGPDPREALIFGQLRILDDQDLAEQDHGGEADDAGGHAEDGHLEDRVRRADHRLRGEEIRDEPERAAGAAHGGDDHHLGDRDLVAGPHERREEEEGRDRRPLFHDAERQGEVAVDRTHDDGEDGPGDETAQRELVLGRCRRNGGGRNDAERCGATHGDRLL